MAAALDGSFDLPPGRSVDWQEFERHRRDLSKYASALAATPDGSDLSYFRAMGGTIQIRERYPELETVPQRPTIANPTQEDLRAILQLAQDRHEWQDEWGPPERHKWRWMTNLPRGGYADVSRIPAALGMVVEPTERARIARDDAENGLTRLLYAPIMTESPWAWLAGISPEELEHIAAQMPVIQAAEETYSSAARAWSSTSGEPGPQSERELTAIYKWTRSLSNARDVPDVGTPDQLDALEQFAKDALVTLDELAKHRATIRDLGIDADTSANASELAARLESLDRSFIFWLRPSYWQTKKQASQVYVKNPTKRRGQLIEELQALQAYQGHDQQLARTKEEVARKTTANDHSIESLVQALGALCSWVITVIPLLREASNKQLLAESITSVGRAKEVQAGADALLAAARTLRHAGKKQRALLGDKAPLDSTLDDVQWARHIAQYCKVNSAAWDAWLAHASDIREAQIVLYQHEEALSEARSHVDHKLGEVQTLLGGLPPTGSGTPDPEETARRVSAWISQNLGQLGPWFQHRQWLQSVKQSKLPGLSALSAETARDEYLAKVQLAMLQPIWEDGMRLPELASFSSARHERIRRLFAEMDAKIHESTRQRLVKELTARVESLVRTKIPGTPMGVLAYELKKKRRRMPIRKLVHQTLPALGQLKPCFMMSPITVATYLAPDADPFDVVIFDEASQVKPEDALVCLMRAHQMVVVGDSKQLPPTSFFDSQESEEEEEVEATAQESILDECEGLGFPTRMLNWHYRSKHHTLIEGSNETFYAGRLLVFHSPHSNAQGIGLRHEYYPESVYGEGGQAVNRREAQHIAKLAEAHWAKIPNKTLGIVAFSKGQADEIYDQINALGSQAFLDWAMAESDEPFFVKNLENVQGDERDHIIISVGYGRDKTGQIKRRFGPVNQKGGERRLNVLFSRARERCTVVSNFKSSDLKVDDIASRGPRILKSFLELAETGTWQARAPTPKEADSDFERAVQAFLVKEGYNVTPQVGCVGYRIDLAVQHPERAGDYAIGIECDGAAYHSSAVARERDRQRQEVLERLGWTIHRMWSTEWFHRASDAKAKLLQAVEAACKTPSEVVEEVTLADTVAVSEALATEAPSNAEAPEALRQIVVVAEEDSDAGALRLDEYAPYEQSSSGSYVDFEWLDETALRSQISSIISQEGPVHQDIVIDRVREINGYGRAGARMRNSISSTVRSLLSQGELVQRKGFLRMRTKGCVPRRRSGSWKATHLPPTEVDIVLFDLVAHAHQIPIDILMRTCIREMGFARLGKDLQSLLDSRIKALARHHFLEITSTASVKIGPDVSKRAYLSNDWGIF